MYPIQLILRDLVIANQTSDMVNSASQDAAAVSESIKHAVIMVATVPILLIYPFMQPYFTQGVMIGSVKE